MTPLPTIHPRLYIGDDSDAHRHLVNQRTPGMNWELKAMPGWAIVHAAKSPWHVEMVGYPRGPAPTDSPERWAARRDRRLALNLVDAAPDEAFAQYVRLILTLASSYISEQLSDGNEVLVHCNVGLSRSPACVLWWMHERNPELRFDECMTLLLVDHRFVRQDSGVIQFVKNQWDLT